MRQIIELERQDVHSLATGERITLNLGGNEVVLMLEPGATVIEGGSTVYGRKRARLRSGEGETVTVTRSLPPTDARFRRSPCPKCGVLFNKFGLNNHTVRCRATKKAGTPQQVAAAVEGNTMRKVYKKGGVFRCGACESKFINQSAAYSHFKRTHTEGRNN